jgi:acetyl esterase
MLDPQAAQAIERISAHNGPPPAQPDPMKARALYLGRRSFTEPEPEPVSLSREHSLEHGQARITLRELRPVGVPADERLPALLYFHGGGWMVGNLDSHDSLCRALANAARCSVISVDYRLAPEHRFPAAYEDALAAHAWLVRQAEHLAIDPQRLALGGDSAGGNLAAAACLSLRGSAQAPRFQLLIYPVTQLGTGTESYQANGQGYLLTREAMAAYIAAYLGPSSREDWRAAPLHAASHAGLPPALVLTAGFDPLRDDGRLYADALSRAGVPAQYVCFERQIHGFVPLGRLIAEARTALDLCGSALRRALAAA